MTKEKYGFVYIWRDKKKNRYYIGRHWGHEDDGYICSSDSMREAHRRRPQDFKRRVLKRIYTSYQELIENEQIWLNKIKKEDFGKKYYNKCSSAYGMLHIWSNKDKINQSQRMINNNPMNKEENRKKNSDWQKQKKWFFDPLTETSKCFINIELVPSGWKKGRPKSHMVNSQSIEANKKRSKTLKGKIISNNHKQKIKEKAIEQWKRQRKDGTIEIIREKNRKKAIEQWKKLKEN